MSTSRRVEDTISILRGLKEKYEAHHKVRITDGALVAAATLSHRYITDRFLPDKAIDLVDEAAARLRMQIDSKPEELDNLDREIVRLKIEQEALKKESDPALEGPAQAAGEGSRRLAGKGRRAHGEMEVREGQAVVGCRIAEAARQGQERSRRRHPPRRLSARRRIAVATIPQLEAKLKDEARRMPRAGTSVAEEAVTANHIAQVVSRWTGIPVDRMLEGEREKLLKMEDALGKRVVGQAEAVQVGVDRGAPRPRRLAGSEPADRLVHVSRARPASARPS